MIRRLALALAALAPLVSAGIATAQTSPSAFTTGFRYDKSQRLVGTIAPDPDGAGENIKYAAVRNTYNTQGWLVKVEQGQLAIWKDEAILPANWGADFTVYRASDYEYDVGGRRTKETLSGIENGTMTVKTLSQTKYDVLDRPDCVAVRMDPAQWAGQTDPCLPQTTGPYGPDRVTQTHYDNAGRVDWIKKAVGVTNLEQEYVRYTFTANGKQSSVTDANKTTAAFAYDEYDRLHRWYFPSKSAALTASTDDYEQYGYDAVGNRTALRKRDGRSFSFTYDPRNRMASKVVPDGPCVAPYTCTTLTAAQTRDVVYGYDNRSLQLFARFDSTSGDGAANSYDNAGRLLSSTLAMDSVTRTLNYVVDPDGNRTRITHPDNAYFETGFDGLDRTDNAWWHTAATGTVGFMDINYEPTGLRSNIGRASSWTAYGYDPAFRLAWMPQVFNVNVTDMTATFAYNPASQMTARVRDNDAYVLSQAPGQKSYTVNGLNQYTTVSGATYAYDSNGSLTSDGATAFGYDAENRLISGSGAKTGTLKYDPLGRLYETAGASGANLTRYLYDGDQLVAEYDGAGAMLKRYYHGPGVDEPVLQDSGAAMNCSTTRVLHGDHQGSIIALADCFGNRTNINKYDDWGNPEAGNLGRFGYTGQIWLPELGLWHYKARAYSSAIGRFMQVDPVGYDDQVNLYAYVGNDPMNATDPKGTATCGQSLKGDECKVALFAADFARSRLLMTANALRSLAQTPASKMSDEQRTLSAKVSSMLGSRSATPMGFKMAANLLTGQANAIGARGEGAVMDRGGRSQFAAEATRGGHIRLNDGFFKLPTLSMTGVDKAFVVLHEGGHLQGRRDTDLDITNPRFQGLSTPAYGKAAAHALANGPGGGTTNDSLNCVADWERCGD